MGIGNWAIGSYCLVVIGQVFALFGIPKYPIPNCQLFFVWLVIVIFGRMIFTKFIKMYGERARKKQTFRRCPLFLIDLKQLKKARTK